MNERENLMDATDFQVEDSFVEDGLLNVLVSRKVSPDEKSGDPEPRWTLLADPKTRELKRIDFCIATNDGFEYPPFAATDEQMSLFNEIARSVNLNSAVEPHAEARRNRGFRQDSQDLQDSFLEVA